MNIDIIVILYFLLSFNVLLITFLAGPNPISVPEETCILYVVYIYRFDNVWVVTFPISNETVEYVILCLVIMPFQYNWSGKLQESLIDVEVGETTSRALGGCSGTVKYNIT